jgi:Fe-S-cluster containining protein
MMRKCTQCGKCCLNYNGLKGNLGTISQKEALLWEKNRPEILRYLLPALDDKVYDVWFSPITREELMRCPWLRKLPNREKYKCRIYDIRPCVCRNYPVNVGQMKKDGCEMLEPTDYDKSNSDLLHELEIFKEK